MNIPANCFRLRFINNIGSGFLVPGSGFEVEKFFRTIAVLPTTTVYGYIYKVHG